MGSIGSLGVIIPSPNRKKKHIDTSIDESNRRRVRCTLHYDGPTTPEALLNLKAKRALGKCDFVEVNNYSKDEINNYLNYYIDRNWLQNPQALTDSGKDELIFLSGSNPLQLKRVCQPI